MTTESTPTPSAESEAHLLARLRAREDAAFDDLVRLTGGRMLAVARRMLGREEDAQDAVQEAFLSAFKALDRFDGRSTLTTWLYRIVVNVCLMRLRAARRHPERSIEDLLPRFLEDGHQQNPSRTWKRPAAAGIEAEELRALVRSKIDELPEPYREVLMLRDIEGLDTDQTAAFLGVTAGSVRTRLHRARQALRTLLDPYFAEAIP
jgi:RNA polymerase sigma-70 factor, ECF subfamily